MTGKLITTLFTATILVASGTAVAEPCDYCDFYSESAAQAEGKTGKDPVPDGRAAESEAGKHPADGRELNKPFFKPTINLNLGSSGDDRKSGRSGLSFGFQPGFKW